MPVIIGVSTALLLLWLFPPLHQNNQNLGTPMSYHQAIERASPAVVNIYAQEHDTSHPQKLLLNSLGSGVIMTADGFILTNYHVIASGSNITVALQDGRIAVAKLIGIDLPTDLAVLQIQGIDLPVIPQSKKVSSQVGDVVLAIGNPFNIGQSITQGIISAFGRHSLGSTGVESHGHQKLIQTDAAINAGSSGGALVNTQGILIGINTAALQSQMNVQGIGFAIPYQVALDIMEQLITHGRVRRGFIGVSVEEINATQAAIMQIPEGHSGIFIKDIVKGSSSEQAGLRIGDMMVTINQVKISSARLALDMITNTAPGTSVLIVVLRNGALVEKQVTVDEDPRSLKLNPHTERIFE